MVLIAGNWKMNGMGAKALAEIEALRNLLADADYTLPRIVLCLPATLISRAVATADSGLLTAGGQKTSSGLLTAGGQKTTTGLLTAGSAIGIGAQDCHSAISGAFTGDISAEMLADAGAKAVIVGHSERRTLHGESDAIIRAKAEAALRAGLIPIICVGETAIEREAGRALDIVRAQIQGSVPATIAGHPAAIAYEPVWAIGTGLVPTLDDIADMHAAIRATLLEQVGPAGADMPILYGGSLNPANARSILAVPEVGGGLVGGASLKAADFIQIIEAAPRIGQNPA